MIAIFVLAVTSLALFPASGSASAPFFTGTYPNTFTFKSSASKFIEGEGGLAMKCTGLSGVGSITTAAGGTLSSELSGCTLSGIPCEATGGGNPKFEGGFELVQINPTTTGIVLSPKELAVTCVHEPGGEAFSVAFRGSVLGTVSPTGVSALTFTLAFAIETGHQKYRECEKGSSCGKVIQLESSFNGKPFVTARLEASPQFTTAKATEIR